MTKALIERFLRSECSLEEADAVIQYFEQHPEAVDLYLGDEEWEKFRAEGKLSAERSAAYWKQVSGQTIAKPTRRLFSLVPVAAAAAVLLLVFAGWWFNRPQDEVKNKESIISTLIQNTTNNIMVLTLPDSSSVQLMPESSISYSRPFQHTTRDIVLKGEAFFTVTKDSLHPFLVYSDAIRTKVLGTRFLVTAFAKENTIRVALFSGHVLIEPADSLHTTLKENIHLLPGDVFLYDKTKMTASITSTPQQQPQQPAVAGKPDAAANLAGNNWYMFNNQSLAEVFDQLQVLYNKKISYAAEDLKGLTFIGKIDRRDTLETILDEICTLNNLKISKAPAGFLIKK